MHNSLKLFHEASSLYRRELFLLGDCAHLPFRLLLCLFRPLLIFRICSHMQNVKMAVSHTCSSRSAVGGCPSVWTCFARLFSLLAFLSFPGGGHEKVIKQRGMLTSGRRSTEIEAEDDSTCMTMRTNRAVPA